MSLLVSLGLSCGGTAISTPDAGGGSPAAGAGIGGASYAGGSNGGQGRGIAYAAGAGGQAVQGGTAGYTVLSCDSPSFDPVSHLTRCRTGLWHRPTAIACLSLDGGLAGGGGTADVGNCQSDSDCAANQLCECQGADTLGKCEVAGCRVDADCGPSSLCVALIQSCSGDDHFMCTSIQDECTSDEDCKAPGQNSGNCTSFGSDHRTCLIVPCSGQGGSSGRPFLVEAAPRVAEVEARSDWLSGEPKPNVTGLSALQRVALSAHWARLGQMEHASIAAFARFNLQLLSLGAPGELIEACNRALVDETAHTRLCFALASEYGGTAVGPARLDIAHCFEDGSLAAIMKLVLREGCLGETVAALEAIEAAAVASDPAVKSVLSRIARDEQTHAELAFKFLAWALKQSPPEARAELAHEAQTALADFEEAALARPADRRREGLASDGVIGAEALRAIHLGAVREIVEPLLATLLDQPISAHHAGSAPSPA